MKLSKNNPKSKQVKGSVASPPQVPHTSSSSVDPHVLSQPVGPGSKHPQPKSSDPPPLHTPHWSTIPTQSSTESQIPSESESPQYVIILQSITHAGTSTPPTVETTKLEGSIQPFSEKPYISKFVSKPEPEGIISPEKRIFAKSN